MATIRFWAYQVRMGRIRIGEVPAGIRDKVQEWLESH